MQFDFAFDPTWNDPTLSAATAEMMRQTRAHWRKLGAAVQFNQENGKLTEWIFRSVAARDAFITKNLSGKPYAIPA